MTDNLKRTFFALDRAMLEAHREDRDEDAEHTARILLGYAELPLLIRARACMVLGCSGVADDALDMAKEAVRVAELGLTLIDDDLAKQLLADCRTVLAEVEAAHTQRAAEEDLDELVEEAESETAEQEDGDGAKGNAEEGQAAAGEKASGPSRTITDPAKATPHYSTPPPTK
ncbi:hypothetical protein CBER1_01230 [Cercospora berteroae]|uniref:Uncharacterized protein n=2 Tax=Cercospora TaxID=29002 RepID=A0A2S6CIW8_9PEZI|nr:hypothetical protein CBER1_01230 [Cercospora berteroae]